MRVIIFNVAKKKFKKSFSFLKMLGLNELIDDTQNIFFFLAICFLDNFWLIDIILLHFNVLKIIIKPSPGLKILFSYERIAVLFSGKI